MNQLLYAPSVLFTLFLRFSLIFLRFLSFSAAVDGVAELPPAVGRLSGLRKLMLTGNQFETVPECIRSCRQLQLLRLSLNRIAAVPRWLLRMPQLAWLAFAGNPCFTAHEHDAAVPVLSIDALHLGEKLGEGASSTVYKATRLTGEVHRRAAAAAGPSLTEPAPTMPCVVQMDKSAR